MSALPIGEEDRRRLYSLNESELIQIARNRDHVFIRRGLPKEILVKLVTGEIEPTLDHLSGTTETRARLEKFIWEHIAQTRSQLPGCDGHCTTYPCSEGRHALCFAGKETIT